ncbi:hypothetical protein C8R48DRAFT_669747 [Suillus tomentosus]|nr:hypothetical protein C8R48DRAFT_669747 [Suillus tomentosus]
METAKASLNISNRARSRITTKLRNAHLTIKHDVLRSLIQQQNCSIKFQVTKSKTQMGSDMEIDPPIIFNGTYGCTDSIMADREVSTATMLVHLTAYASERPDPSLSLQPETGRTLKAARTTALKGSNSFAACRKLQINDLRTEQLRKRVNIALRTATLGFDIHGMMPHYRSADYAQPRGDETIVQTTNEYIIPPAVARGIANCVAKGLRSLRNTLSANPKSVEPIVDAALTKRNVYVKSGKYWTMDEKKKNNCIRFRGLYSEWNSAWVLPLSHARSASNSWTNFPYA